MHRSPKWTLFVLVLAGLGTVTCSRQERGWKVATDDPNWGKGYNAGSSDGIEVGRSQICDEIRRYKKGIAKDLNDNTQICGWSDLDHD